MCVCVSGLVSCYVAIVFCAVCVSVCNFGNALYRRHHLKWNPTLLTPLSQPPRGVAAPTTTNNGTNNDKDNNCFERQNWNQLTTLTEQSGILASDKFEALVSGQKLVRLALQGLHSTALHSSLSGRQWVGPRAGRAGRAGQAGGGGGGEVALWRLCWLLHMHTRMQATGLNRRNAARSVPASKGAVAMARDGFSSMCRICGCIWVLRSAHRKGQPASQVGPLAF